MPLASARELRRARIFAVLFLTRIAAILVLSLWLFMPLAIVGYPLDDPISHSSDPSGFELTIAIGAGVSLHCYLRKPAFCLFF